MKIKERMEAEDMSIGAPLWHQHLLQDAYCLYGAITDNHARASVHVSCIAHARCVISILSENDVRASVRL